jgi:Predicted membrane protein
MRWYFDVLTNNYLNFNGRARRKEFWMYTLVHLGILLLTGLLGMWPFTIYFVLTVIPSVGVGIRRLHDTKRSGWWILIANVPPKCGPILLFYAI